MNPVSFKVLEKVNSTYENIFIDLKNRAQSAIIVTYNASLK